MRTSKRLEVEVGGNMSFGVIAAFDAFGAAVPKAPIFGGALPGTLALWAMWERDSFQV